MRIATNSFPGSLVSQLNQLNERQALYQKQAVSGQRVQWADDDPVAMRQALDLRAQTQQEKQYAANITSLQQRATISFDTIRAVQKLGDKASELAISSDGSASPTTLKDNASQINGLIEDAVRALNTKDRDDYVFGGTQSGQPPFVMTKDANGLVTGVTYQGNADLSETQIADGTTVSAQPPGANTTGSGAQGLVTDSRNGADFFNHLIVLRDHLLAGDTAAIAATDVPALKKDEDNMVSLMASSSAMQGRLETAASSSTARVSNLKKQISTRTDADLAETLVKLTQTQNAYQAALQSGASLMQKSLMDYLR